MPAVKKRTKAKIIEIIIATLIFLYCLALMFFNMASFIVFICALNLKISLKIPIYKRDCNMLNKIIAPKIINKNMVLKSKTCKSSCPSKTANGIQ